MKSGDVVKEHGGDERAARVEWVWQQIREHLDQQRRRIAFEITKYPSPIAGCDAQFTALLEQREDLVQELRRCDEYKGRGMADGEARARVDEFLTGSTYVPVPLAQKLRSAMRAGTGPHSDATAEQA